MKSEDWQEVYLLYPINSIFQLYVIFCPNYVVDCFNFLLPSACLDTSELAKKMRELSGMPISVAKVLMRMIMLELIPFQNISYAQPVWLSG